MKVWLKSLLIGCFIICLSSSLKAQSIVQTYLDPCDNKTYTVAFPLPNNSVTILIRNQIKSFTYAEAQSGAIQLWINQIFATPCPVSQTTTVQIVTQAVGQAASSAASAAASAASSAASSASSTSTASVPSSSSSSSSSSSQSSSSTGESNSSSTSESSGDSNSDSKSESKEESKSESKEEKKEDKKEGKKEQARINPIVFSSDLTVGQNADMSYASIASFGMSQSSLTGEASWGANAMVWSNLQQFALSGRYTKMEFEQGELTGIHNYSFTTAYLNRSYMSLIGYTYIKPTKKWGTMGYNLSFLGLALRNPKIEGINQPLFTTLTSYSLTGFWMRPFTVNKKMSLVPELFVMSSPVLYNMLTNTLTKDKNVGVIGGTSINYSITKRFAFSMNYKLSTSTNPLMPALSFFLIGSRINL